MEATWVPSCELLGINEINNKVDKSGWVKGKEGDKKTGKGC